MYIKIVLFFLFIISCSYIDKLNYPSDIHEIKGVVLERSDSNSNGKFAEIKQLNDNQVKQLLVTLSKARQIDSKSFDEDFQIIFSTESGTKRIMVRGNKIKNFESNKVYQIPNVDYLNNF